jgi:hypothetical protein
MYSMKRAAAELTIGADEMKAAAELPSSTGPVLDKWSEFMPGDPHRSQVIETLNKCYHVFQKSSSWRAIQSETQQAMLRGGFLVLADPLISSDDSFPFDPDCEVALAILERDETVDNEIEGAEISEMEGVEISGADDGDPWSSFMPDQPNRKKVINALTTLYNRIQKNVSDWKEHSRKLKLDLLNFFCEVDSDTSLQSLEDVDIEAALAILEPAAAVDSVAKSDSAPRAFKVSYAVHEDDQALLEHLEKQRTIYLHTPEYDEKAPYFAVIQSSGYGKSRMIFNLKGTNSTYRVIYWSFRSKEACPVANVMVANTFNMLTRDDLKRALIAATMNSIMDLKEDSINMSTVNPVKAEEGIIRNLSLHFKKRSTTFVIDEASAMLQGETSDGVSFFRSLRAAIRDFSRDAYWLFFVVMATHPSITHLSPSVKSFKPKMRDPSFKPVGHDDSKHGPLEPFILGSSYRINNDRSSILEKCVDRCLEQPTLLSMGRPLWRALLGKDEESTGMSPDDLVHLCL